MKILILVQSIEKSRYPEVIKYQKSTWDSIEVSNMKTIFYYQDPNKDGLIGQDLFIKSNMNPNFMFNVFIEALRRSLEYEWDFIFRTDNSTYINKPLLAEILNTKPTSAYYGGKTYTATKVSISQTRLPFLWGEGITLSRDVVKFLVLTYGDIYPPMYYGPDDLQLGKVLHNVVEPDTSFPICEYYKENEDLPVCPVYRCKNDKDLKAFDDTINAFINIHKHITGEEKKREEHEALPI